MRKSILLLITFIAAFSECYGQNIDVLLKKLDKAIANRSVYLAEKENNLEELRKEAFLKQGVDQFEAFSQLFIEYKTFCADSALHYADLCEEWAQKNNDPMRLQQAQIKRMIGLGVIAQFDKSNTIIQQLEKHIFPENQEAYFSARSDVRYWQGSFSLLPEFKHACFTESLAYRDSVSKITHNHALLAESEAILINNSTDPRQAAILARKYLERLPEGHDSIRHFAHHLGNYYQSAGRRDSSEYYFAMSAISDMELGIKEYLSLISLTKLLFEDGKINRAYTYMTQCLKDAEECKSALRTQEMSKMMPQIMAAYNRELKQKECILLGISIILLLVAVVAILELVRILRVQRKLKNIQKKVKLDNLELKNLNSRLERHLKKEIEIGMQLQETNAIKDTYLGNYMRQCSAVIDKLENYRKQLQTLALRNNTTKLFDAIRSTEVIDQEVEALYKGFDETFLSIFPTFVEEINQLMTPEGQLIPPAPKRLNAELRIVALIRLGITDSNDIAAFLRYSIKTIYNYRTKVRNNALGNRNELEEKIKKIGIKQFEMQ